MAKLQVTVSMEIDTSEPLAFPPDYMAQLLDPLNWNDFDREFGDEIIPADDLRSMIMEISSVEDLTVVSVKEVE